MKKNDQLDVAPVPSVPGEAPQLALAKDDRCLLGECRLWPHLVHQLFPQPAWGHGAGRGSQAFQTRIYRAIKNGSGKLP